MRRVTPVIVPALLSVVLWQWFVLIDHGHWRTRHTIGLAVLIPGCVLWAIARYQLGTNFTARAEARALVTAGLYSRVRHPIYLSAELVILGVLMFLGRPILFVVWAAMVPLQIRRARREESVLECAFGERYRAYKAGRARSARLRGSA